MVGFGVGVLGVVGRGVTIGGLVWFGVGVVVTMNEGWELGEGELVRTPLDCTVVMLGILSGGNIPAGETN